MLRKQQEISFSIICILSWASDFPMATNLNDLHVKNMMSNWAAFLLKSHTLRQNVLKVQFLDKLDFKVIRLSLRGGCSPFPVVPVPPRSFFEGLYGPPWKNAILDRPEDGLYENLRAGMPVDAPPHEAMSPSMPRPERSSEKFISSVRLPSSITNRSLEELNYQDRAKIEILNSAKRLQRQGLMHQRIRRKKQDKILWRLKTALLAPASVIKHCLVSLLRCAGLLPTKWRRLKYIRDVTIDPPPPPAHDLPVSGPLGLLLLEHNGGGETVARYRRRHWEHLWAQRTGWLRPCFGIGVAADALL
jgi:hypothetical protein